MVWMRKFISTNNNPFQASYGEVCSTVFMGALSFHVNYFPHTTLPTKARTVNKNSMKIPPSLPYVIIHPMTIRKYSTAQKSAPPLRCTPPSLRLLCPFLAPSPCIHPVVRIPTRVRRKIERMSAMRERIYVQPDERAMSPDRPWYSLLAQQIYHIIVEDFLLSAQGSIFFTRDGAVKGKVITVCLMPSRPNVSRVHREICSYRVLRRFLAPCLSSMTPTRLSMPMHMHKLWPQQHQRRSLAHHGGAALPTW